MANPGEINCEAKYLRTFSAPPIGSLGSDGGKRRQACSTLALLRTNPHLLNFRTPVSRALRLYSPPGYPGTDREPVGIGISAAEETCRLRLTIRRSLYKVYLMTATMNLDMTFAALADPTRRAILARLAKGEATVMELAAP